MVYPKTKILKAVMKIKKCYLTVVMFTILLLILSSGTALATDLTTYVNVLNPVPQVSDIGLYDAATGLPVSSMNPTQSYVLKMLVSDNESLNDIAEVDVNISSLTTPSAGWISSSNVNFKWFSTYVNGVNSWDRYNDTNPISFTTVDKTWDITMDSNYPSDMNLTSGLFTLGFYSGELAQYGSWSIRIRVIDTKGNVVTGSLDPVTMNKYIAMSVQDWSGYEYDGVNFGDVAPGGYQFSDPLYTQVRTNAPYSLAASTTSLTSANGILIPVSAITGANQFVMSVDDTLNTSETALETPQVLPANPITGFASVPAPTAGVGEAENPARTILYLQLQLAPTITVQEAYTGTVTLTASNN